MLITSTPFCVRGSASPWPGSTPTPLGCGTVVRLGGMASLRTSGSPPPRPENTPHTRAQHSSAPLLQTSPPPPVCESGGPWFRGPEAAPPLAATPADGFGHRWPSFSPWGLGFWGIPLALLCVSSFLPDRGLWLTPVCAVGWQNAVCSWEWPGPLSLQSYLHRAGRHRGPSWSCSDHRQLLASGRMDSRSCFSPSVWILAVPGGEGAWRYFRHHFKQEVTGHTSKY